MTTDVVARAGPEGRGAPHPPRGHHASFDLAALRREAAPWDDFVDSVPMGAYTQITAWADVKRANGWTPERVVADGGSGPIGAQILVRRLSPTPFGVGYAPRGPLAVTLDEASLRAFTDEVRALAGRLRLTHVTVDPEVEGAESERLFERLGWVRGRDVQPRRTRIIDIDRPEEEIWGGLRSKWRQYVVKARKSGVVVTESDASGLEDFYSILSETATRTGFPYRSMASYRRVYETFAARGAGRLLFARVPDGTPVATLMLVHSGRRVVEPYGGMTAAGGASRANYVLKWEAIRSSHEAGFGFYDMWGLARPGIEHFKAGFGGREVSYVGAFDLIRSRPLRAALIGAYRLRVAVAQRRMPARTEPGEQVEAL